MQLHARIDFTWDATSVAIAPDDTFLATASHDGAVVIRRLANGEILRTLPQQPAAVWSMAFSPDGTLLALGSDDNPNSPDGTVELWDTLEWSHIQTLASEDTGGTWSLAFVSDSSHIAIGHTDGYTRLWRVKDATVVRTFPNTCEIPKVATALNEPILAQGCDETVSVFNLITDTMTHQFENHRLWIHSLAFAPTEPYIAVSTTEGPVCLWHIDNGRLVGSFLERIEVRCLAFSPNGQVLACGCDDGNIRIVRLSDYHILHTLTAHNGWIRSVAFAKNGTTLVSSGTDGKVCIWRE